MDAEDIYERFKRIQGLLRTARLLDEANIAVRGEICPPRSRFTNDPDAWMYGEPTKFFEADISGWARELEKRCRDFLDLCSADLLDAIAEIEPQNHHPDDSRNAFGWGKTWWQVRKILKAAEGLCAAVVLDQDEANYQRTWRNGEFKFADSIKGVLNVLEEYQPFNSIVVKATLQRAVPGYRETNELHTLSPQTPPTAAVKVLEEVPRSLVAIRGEELATPVGFLLDVAFETVLPKSLDELDESAVVGHVERRVSPTPLTEPAGNPPNATDPTQKKREGDKRKKTADELMERALNTVTGADGWTVTQFATHTGKRASTIKGCKTWKRLMVVREIKKMERMENDRQRA